MASGIDEGSAHSCLARKRGHVNGDLPPRCTTCHFSVTVMWRYIINRAIGQNLGEFKAADPVVTKIPGSETYHFIQKFRRVYKDHVYAGAYEIITRVQGDVTNNYFIGYTDYMGPPDFYDKFRERALK